MLVIFSFVCFWFFLGGGVVFFFCFCLFFFFYTFTEKPHFLLKPKGNVGRQILCKCVLVASVRECMEADDLFLACRSVSP